MVARLTGVSVQRVVERCVVEVVMEGGLVVNFWVARKPPHLENLSPEDAEQEGLQTSQQQRRAVNPVERRRCRGCLVNCDTYSLEGRWRT